MCIDGWRYHSWNSLSASRGYPLLHPFRPRDLQATRLRSRDERVEMIKQVRPILSFSSVVEICGERLVDYSSCRNFRRVRDCRRRCGSDKVCRTLVRRRRKSSEGDQEEGVEVRHEW